MAAEKASVDTIFCAAIEIASEDERAAYLARACDDDQELRVRVEKLLDAHVRAGSFLEPPACSPIAIANDPRTERPGTMIGPYKLLEQIGEGGFGVVFLAEQQPLRRKVALKVIKPGMDSKQVIARFEAERQALALMEHANIAKVLDAGSTPGPDGTGLARRPYFVMELVRGIPVTEFCDQNQLPVRGRLELFVAVCQAVQHAHQKGIIHRDLKPSNVLVTLQDGTPLVKVIDFGIAKALGQERLTDKTLFTGFAQMIGTPLYMSPEQAEMSGQDADTRTDIYALGVLLYELLTGTTPFDKERLKEASYEEIRRIIREEEPAKPSTRISTLGQAATTVSGNRKSEPRRLSQLFRGELDWIVMKALEKDRNRRYDTASNFAADVERYLHDEPVQACPPSAVYRFRKFGRRNKAALTMASAIAITVFMAVVVSSGLIWRANRELRQNLYYQRIALAEREWSANNLGRMEQLLEECPAKLRGWEWHYLKRLRHKTFSPLDHASLVLCVGYSPTGQYLASGTRGGVIKLWDAQTGQPFRIFHAGENMVSPVLGAGTIGFLGSSLGQGSFLATSAFTLRGTDKMVFRVAFSPDGQRLAAACSDGIVKIWDLQADKQLLNWKAHPSSVTCVVFSSDGQRLVSSCASHGWEGEPVAGEIKVWDAATGAAIFPLKGHTLGVLGVAFSPDGQRLASAGGQDETVKVWDAATGLELFTCRGHTAPVQAVVFSPDGQSLASVSGDWGKLSHGEVKLWDARSGELRLTLRGHIGFILSVAFSPDGQRLASAGMDRSIKIWDVATGRETLTLRGHGDFIRAVTFSPDSCLLASACEDQTVRIWDATPLEERTGEEPLTLAVHPAGVLGLAFHPDGQGLASVAGDAVKLWDSHTGKVLRTFPDSAGFWGIAFNPDGQRLAACGEGEIKVWDVGTGQRIHSMSGFRNIARRVAFSSDSRYLVSAHWDRTVRVWDAVTGDVVRIIQEAHVYAINDLALSLDGKSLVTASVDNSVKVWDMVSGRYILTLPPQPVHTHIAFRPDGQVLASASADGTIKLWNTNTWKQEYDLRDSTGGVETLVFSPDGRLLAWGSTDATVKLWDARTNRIHTLRGHTSWVEGVAFSRNGKWIASASLDGTVKLWPVPAVPASHASVAGESGLTPEVRR